MAHGFESELCCGKVCHLREIISPWDSFDRIKPMQKAELSVRIKKIFGDEIIIIFFNYNVLNIKCQVRSLTVRPFSNFGTLPAL
jgi:hypothetical protein